MTKRIFDLSVSSLLLIALSPIFAVLAALVAIRLGRPVLFKQQRPGLNGEPFMLYKFRTMRDLRGPDGKLLPDADRITPLGRRLRSSSLDELPEFWNVLKGEMSLVGPRPLRMEYLSRYTPDQARRHLVKPGITGLAQIGGRNALSWEEKFALDIEYVDTHTLATDMAILLRTFRALFSRRGISHGDHATMPEFWGTEDPSSDGRG